MIYAGNNIGEDYLAELSEFLKDKKFGVINISKSGTTTETALAFRLLKKQCEDQRGKEGNQVDDQQILRDGWYAEHHKIYDLLIYYLRFWPCGAISAAKLRKISCFSPKNGGNTTFFH
jgi:hypothetical protein